MRVYRGGRGKEEEVKFSMANRRIFGAKRGITCSDAKSNAPLFGASPHDALPYYQPTCRNKAASHLEDTADVKMEDPPFEDLPFELRDDNEWINNDDLWGFLRGNLSGEEYSEFERYQTQNMLRLDRERRREEFEEKVKLQRQVFEEEERDRWNKKVFKFGHKLLVCKISLSLRWS